MRVIRKPVNDVEADDVRCGQVFDLEGRVLMRMNTLQSEEYIKAINVTTGEIQSVAMSTIVTVYPNATLTLEPE